MVYVMEKKSFIIGIILLLVIMVGSTYAFYKWNSSDNMDVDVKIEGATVTFNGGDDIIGTLIPVSKKEEGIKKDIKVKASAEGATFNLYMNLTTMTDRLKEESFKYEVYYNDSSLVKSGNFGEHNSSTNPNGISYGDIQAYNCFEPILYGVGSKIQEQAQYFHDLLLRDEACYFVARLGGYLDDDF